jgi:hypothetical protein
MTKKSRQQTETRKSNRTQREEGFDAAITQFEADIAQAVQIEDPAEQILKLDEIKQNILETEAELSGAKWGEEHAIADSALSAGLKAGWMFLPVAPAAQAIREESVRKKRKAEVKDHMQKMGGQEAQMHDLRRTINGTIDTIAENNVTKICLSPLQEQVLGVLGISGSFTRAAVKEIAAYATQAAETASLEETVPEKKNTSEPGRSRQTFTPINL